MPATKSAPLFDLIAEGIKADGKEFVKKVNGVIQVRGCVGGVGGVVAVRACWR